MSAGSIDPDGYRRVHLGKLHYDMEHRVVWRRHRGPIPAGMDVHHKDEDKLNNEIGNLELIPKSDHARMHRRAQVGGYEIRDGVEHKACRSCLVVFPLSNFYDKPSGKNRSQSKHCWCKPCYNNKVVERRRRRRVNV
jgi:hypothetical protein